MSKIFTFMFLLCNLWIAHGQKVFQSQSAVNELLCRDWAYDYSVQNGAINSNPTKQEVYNLLFFTNLTLQITRSGTKDIGSWCLNPSQQIIEITLYGNHNLNIYSISENEIIIVTKDYKSKNFPKSYVRLIPQK